MNQSSTYKQLKKCGLLILFLVFLQGAKADSLPKKWLNAWISPSLEYRPLQIVHGADIRDKASYYKDTCGLGGVVCNVPFGKNYLKSEDEWTVYVAGVKAMQDNGLRVWIYDEDGYPSLGAGGRVLEADPSLEAQELVYDKDNVQQPFQVRPCYEFTHACNNFYVARRYPNPLNPKATEKFIELTHEAYLKHLGSKLYGQIEAFFTDEPSMMAVNLGELQEKVRKNVRVTDPTDPNKKNLPMISWSENIANNYQKVYEENLNTNTKSLFAGSNEKDKTIRQKFWSLLAGLDHDYYYTAIQNWCKASREMNKGKGPLASGHGLREEYPAIHVPLDGNKLLVSSGFDIPGLDQLSSDPTIWRDDAWMAVFFPNSAAMLNEHRRVMCEMSDFDQTLNGKRPADLQHMQAATAWQMAFGVTDFNLYYSITYGDKYPYRQEPQYKDYCTFVGRINSLLLNATPVRKVLLYYPIYDFQREYIPTAEKMSVRTQSELTQTLSNSFRDLGANLLKAQAQFVLVDYLTLEKSRINTNGTIQIGKNQYSSIVLPKGITLPTKVSTILEQAKNKGFKLISANDDAETTTLEQLAKLIGAEEKITPMNTSIAYGKYLRDGREIYILVNTGDKDYSGNLNLKKGTECIELNPQTGDISNAQRISKNSLTVNLAPLQTKLWVVK